MSFKSGDRVMLVNSLAGCSIPVGSIGTVQEAYDGLAWVVFDRRKEKLSIIRECKLARVEFDDPETESIVELVTRMLECHQDEAFTFKIDLDPMLENEKEETSMNTMYNEKNCRVAGVTLDPYNSKEYAYALFLNDVEIGAKVVVRNSDGSLVLGRLASIDNHPHAKVKNGCEVICVIDMTEYNKRQEQFAKVADLRKKMDARVKALQDIALYELLAKDDPELKDLLAEFKSLGA